jgi:hypothetical protein
VRAIVKRRKLTKRQIAYRKKLRRRQVTCLCGVYEFPHRLGGGKCYGRDWTASYYESEGIYCSCCVANINQVCEVASGQEEIRYCEGAIDHLHSRTKYRHPYWSLPVDPQSVKELEDVECPF